MRLRYADAELRDLRFGAVEVVRRVYPVFQDRNWTARPWRVESERIDARSDAFVVEASGTGTLNAGTFRWQARIEGRPDGTVTYEFRGQATEPFLRNRLGLCVLHPIRGLEGAPVSVEHAGGSMEASAFPAAIDPHQPFADLRAISHEPVPGLRATVRMEGDVFESEDHRNWTDASIKHYCTPISLPFPVEVRPGDEVAHRVTITVAGSAPSPAREPLRIDIDPGQVPLPALGLRLDGDGHRLTAHEAALLGELCLAHVRVDLGPEDDEERLAAAILDASAIGARLVVALAGADPARYRGFRGHPAIDRWLVFDPGAKATDPTLVERAADALGPRVGGGTDLYFTELNRGRPAALDLGSGAFVSFSANPQVHFRDDESVMQNAWTLGEVARQARALYPGAFLELSPLTLRPRWNPNATAPELDVSGTPLPSRVDPRQCAPFAAAWTVLALSSLVNAGALDAVTLFAATGWEGVVERVEGSPQPGDFASVPGQPFPVHAVLRAVAGQRAAHRAVSSDPDAVGALALASGTVLVANATPRPQQPLVDGIAVDLAPYEVATITRRQP